jgi:hypothetical protein
MSFDYISKLLLRTAFVLFCDHFGGLFHCLATQKHLFQVVLVLNFHDSVLNRWCELTGRLLQIIKGSTTEHLEDAKKVSFSFRFQTERVGLTFELADIAGGGAWFGG